MDRTGAVFVEALAALVAFRLLQSLLSSRLIQYTIACFVAGFVGLCVTVFVPLRWGVIVEWIGTLRSSPVALMVCNLFNNGTCTVEAAEAVAAAAAATSTVGSGGIGSWFRL